MNDGQAFWRLSGAHRHLVERFRPRHATPAPWGEQEDTADGTGAQPDSLPHAHRFEGSTSQQRIV